MNEKIITVAAARQAMHEVVAEYGEDFVYLPPEGVGEKCLYSNADGTPSCIVGHIVAKLDPDGYALLVNEERTMPSGHREGAGSAWGIVESEYIHVESETLKSALDMAQALQDRGATWGAALQKFEGVLSRAEES